MECGAGPAKILLLPRAFGNPHSSFYACEGEQNLKRLYIGNLPYRATEADLTTWFQQQGVNASGVNVMRDRFSNESRGFGFAEVDDPDIDRAVEQCNGKQFMGRALVINEARPMEKGGGGQRRARTESGH